MLQIFILMNIYSLQTPKAARLPGFFEYLFEKSAGATGC
jgi:hypothetical protein